MSCAYAFQNYKFTETANIQFELMSKSPTHSYLGTNKKPGQKL
jgi:hypothetical protein